MACRVDDNDLPEEQQPLVNLSPSQASTEPQKIDYDFVEEPSQDFFCPVTLELLTDPHLTMCCGNHLSQEAANRLKRDGKPCPMCKAPQLNTVPNKHYKRKVNEIKIRCPHKKNGCEWVGGVNEVKQHSDSCQKRPWQCQYCEFESTCDIGVNKHLPMCTKFPVVCPNSCEVGSVPRCDHEAHLMVCPLQPVPCEYAEVGCDVKVPRRDLGCHMEEGQQQHLLSVTLLILRLTRENTKEKNKLLQMVEEKKELQTELLKEKEAIVDLKEQLKQALEIAQQNAKETMAEKLKGKEYERELAVRDQQIKKKDETIADLQKQLKQVQDGLDAKVAALQQQLVKYGEDTQEHLKQQDKHVEYTSVRLGFNVNGHIRLSYIQQGFSVHDFTLTEFKKCQAKGGEGDWYSKPFYSHPGGYKFKLNVETNGDWYSKSFYGDHDVYMNVLFQQLEGDHDDKLDWPVFTTAHVQLLNQLGDHRHHEKTSTSQWGKGGRGQHDGKIKDFFNLSELGLNAEKNTQYLKNDCLQFRVYFKAS